MLIILLLFSILSLSIGSAWYLYRKQEKTCQKPKERVIQPKIEYELKLNLKAIMMYERLTHNSFIDFVNGANEKDVIPLIYCMIAANNKDFNQSFDDTVRYLFTNEAIMGDMTRRVKDQMNYLSQFGTVDFLIGYQDVDINEKKDTTKGEKKEKVYLSSFIPPLISDCGLSIHYVLYDMPFQDIDLYMKYRDDRKKEELEERRLFVYTLISPHIDSKKLPYDKFMVFPWEKAKKHRESLEYLNNKAHQEQLKAFLNSKPIKIDDK